jgi:pyruvate formate lyase activating enzyme
VEDILGTVVQDRPFYETSGGGMTISGGEPLAQPDFALALLQEAKRLGIHTVLDTSGMVQQHILESVLPFVDLVLFDVKHLDSEAHRKATGKENKVILENLRFLDGKVDIWIRVPVIPNFNDDKTLFMIAELAERMPSVKKLCLLPYHRWGSGKYAGLGMDYRLESLVPPLPERMEEVVQHCQGLGSEKVEIYVV